MDFLRVHASKSLLLANIILALSYLICIAFLFPIGNPILFGLLLAGEVFHVWQILGYVHCVWPKRRERAFGSISEPVAIFITVCGEPAEVIAATVKAANAIDYPNYRVYVLNDGKVANKANWYEAEEVAARYEVACITREVPGGAKAGNVNHALAMTTEPFIVVFDADHVPKPHFLRRMMGYFVDEQVGFVQSPQYYKNHDLNMVTGGAWEQQALFFGAICKGKDQRGATFMCGTNMVVRRALLDELGGMDEDNIAEDFLTSLAAHAKGWQSVYVDEVLAKGLAPEDFLSYYKQQFRWARGSLEVIFSHNPLFMRGLTWDQRFQYLASSSYYLSGLVVFVDALLPVLFLFTGLEPLRINTMTLALIFIPYITVALYNLQLTSNFSYTFRALSFSLSSFPIHLQAIWAVLRRKKTGFSVTSKTRLGGSFTYLVSSHILYIALGIGSFIVALMREGLSASVLSNVAWILIYIAIFAPFISAAMQKSPEENTPLDITNRQLRQPDSVRKVRVQ